MAASIMSRGDCVCLPNRVSTLGAATARPLTSCRIEADLQYLMRQCGKGDETISSEGSVGDRTREQEAE